ncbi:MAG: hypothetical protein RLZZ455_305 [Candidatus Parcubacteria bacterium]
MMRSFFFKYKYYSQGSSNMYVLVIILVIIIISYLLAGGLVPNIVKTPEDPVAVQVATPRTIGNTNTLQLINLEVSSEQQ